MSCCVYWLRQDLRLQDNPALTYAVKEGFEIIPIYIYSPHEEEGWGFGGASKWWLHHSLLSLGKDLKEMGARLILRQGDSLQQLLDIVSTTKAESVIWNRRYEPRIIERDKKIKEKLSHEHLNVKSFNGSLLYEPWEIKNKQGSAYKVYTPFWNEVSSKDLNRKPFDKPREVKAPKKWPSTLSVNDLNLISKINWADSFFKEWQPGEEGALKNLKSFLKESVEDYKEARDLPAKFGTSKLSPHLHFGEISPLQIWNATPKKIKNMTFLKQIIWREFAFHLLYHFPKTDRENFRESFNSFPWRKDAKALRAWQKGVNGVSDC
jgi:deoxyribodipyrimidine photo-lyase